MAVFTGYYTNWSWPGQQSWPMTRGPKSYLRKKVIASLIIQQKGWRATVIVCVYFVVGSRSSISWNQWCWQCWQYAPLSQLVKRVVMSHSIQENVLSDGWWVGSNWQGQLCCWWPSPPAHCSLGYNRIWTCTTDRGDRQFRENKIVESDKKHNW